MFTRGYLVASMMFHEAFLAWSNPKSFAKRCFSGWNHPCPHRSQDPCYDWPPEILNHEGCYPKQIDHVFRLYIIIYNIHTNTDYIIYLLYMHYIYILYNFLFNIIYIYYELKYEPQSIVFGRFYPIESLIQPQWIPCQKVIARSARSQKAWGPRGHGSMCRVSPLMCPICAWKTLILLPSLTTFPNFSCWTRLFEISQSKWSKGPEKSAGKWDEFMCL